MTRKIGGFVALALVLATLFVNLGFWQLRRLRERRARNAEMSARLQQPLVPFERLPDTASHRKAFVSGEADFANEIVLTGRSRNGSPGVYFLTPIRDADGDSAVIVIRGWAYSPDAASIDQARWRERRDSFSGYVLMMPTGAAATAGRRAHALRKLTVDGVRRLVPYPVASRYLVSEDAAADTAPARLGPPSLDDGNHLSYAIQWFSFAAIAVIGAGAVVSRARVSPESRQRTEVH